MEIRLDPALPRSEPLPPPVSVEAAELLRVLRAAPMTARQERILRTIASKYYAEGHCYARQSTIAEAIGCAKSTVQLDLDELEARGLIRVHRRQGTSNLTILADGMIEALKVMRIDRRRTLLRGRGIEVPATSFRAPLSPAIPVPVRPPQEVVHTSNRPKAVSPPRPSQSTSLNPDLISTIPPTRAQERGVPHDDGRKNDGNETANALIREGITPKRARLFARIFDTDRIEANVRLGLHREKQNPGGYLAYMIQHDVAAAHVAPGSEAERVRQSERVPPASSPREQRTVPVPVPSPSKTVSEKPSPHDDAAADFALLSPGERAEYEALAEREIRRRLSGLGSFFDVKRPTIQAMMFAHAVQAFRARNIGATPSFDQHGTST